MTCIIGLETDDGVWIGADSAGTDGYGGQTIRADTKVFRNGPMVMGFCGSYRMGQLLRYNFVVPSQPDGMGDYEYMVRVFVEAVRKTLKDGGFTWVEKNTETGGFFLVAYNGSLYSIEDDFQVGMSTRSYVCIGSGEQYAMGAMAALDLIDLTETERVKKALKITSEHDSQVAGPFKVIKL